MKPYELCRGALLLRACDRCRRNPQRPENRAAADEDAQRWRMPILNSRGCIDQLHAPAIDDEAAA